MRILRGLGGRILPCGCLLGVYETYSGRTIAILDAREASCADPNHWEGAPMNLDPSDVPNSDVSRRDLKVEPT